MEQLGFFTALGVVIVFIAAAALGRIASVTSGIRAVEPEPVPAETAPISTVPASTAPASTEPASTEPASTASDLPLRTRADAVPAKHARTEPTGDTTQTIG